MLSTRGWDLAGTEGKGDHTAGAKVGYSVELDTYFLQDMVRGKWSPGRVMQRLKNTARRDGYECQIRIEREPGSSGKLAIEAIQQDLLDYDVQGIPATGRKELRWDPLAAVMEAGRFYIVQDRFTEPFLKELLAVPASKHDDQTDAAALAYNQLRRAL